MNATRNATSGAFGERVEDTFNPVGRLYYAGSTFLCVPNALSQEGGQAAAGKLLRAPTVLSRRSESDAVRRRLPENRPVPVVVAARGR